MPGWEYLEAVILGIVQGITEFLPISSSGHLVLFSEGLHRLTGRTVDADSSLQMNVALHLGTLFSIVAVYCDELRRILRDRRMCLLIILATIPVALIGLAFEDWIEQELLNPRSVGMSLLLTAALLIFAQRVERGERGSAEVSWRNALVVGLFQAVAIVPGISRSGSTISGGMITGMRRDLSATFSFLIAIPAIAGAVVLTIGDILEGEGGANPVPVLLAGALVSFVVGLVALRWLLRIVARGKLHWFGWYCAVVGTAALAWGTIDGGW